MARPPVDHLIRGMTPDWPLRQGHLMTNRGRVNPPNKIRDRGREVRPLFRPQGHPYGAGTTNHHLEQGIEVHRLVPIGRPEVINLGIEKELLHQGREVPRLGDRLPAPTRYRPFHEIGSVLTSKPLEIGPRTRSHMRQMVPSAEKGENECIWRVTCLFRVNRRKV